MAIQKLSNGTYQAKLLSLDGRTWHSQVFPTKEEAEEQQARWKKEKKQGKLKKGAVPTLDEFFVEWFRDVSQETSPENRTGWRECQLQQYRLWIQPHLGNRSMKDITPQMVKRVLNEMAMSGKAPGTQRHIFVLLRKIFGDAIENFQYLTFNPVLKKLRPPVPVKEATRLNLDQIKKLLEHVDGKKYGLAIWIQLYLGLRCGELQALTWEDVDLEEGRIHIRKAFVKKTGLVRDYPKGKKHHSHSIPGELLERLKSARASSQSQWVVPSVEGPQFILSQRWYRFALTSYCRALEIPEIGTHGLRHSTSEIYLSHGASRDDLRQLFAHSSLVVTDRYIRDRWSNLEQVTNVIRLFPEKRIKKADNQ